MYTNNSVSRKGRKSYARPRTGQEGLEKKQNYIRILFLISTLDVGKWLTPLYPRVKEPVTTL
jgi:hypothetical protein